MRQFLQWRVGDAILLGEANVLPRETRKYFNGDGGDRIHMMFNFFVNQHLFYALATADVRPLIQAIRATQNIPPAAQWAQFLRNHDELDLGRLTEEECPEIGWGNYRILSTGTPSLLAIRYDWRGNSVLVVHNFDEKPHEARIKPQVEMGDTLASLLNEEESHADRSGMHRIPLEAFGYRWFRVGGLNYAIFRKKG